MQGDASEAGILKCMEDQYGDIIAYRSQYPKICEIPFNSTNKFQVSIHEMNDTKDQRYMLVMKVIHEILFQNLRKLNKLQNTSKGLPQFI